MLLYLTLGSNDLARARRFYDPVMATLGHVLTVETNLEIAYSTQGTQDNMLWIVTPHDRKTATHGNGTMLALAAPSRAHVRAFHATALANGGSDEGAPGLRYSEHFYSCYVRDPDGNKLSAVCDDPAGGA
jgi:predicted lactoylglutathione lyase